MAASLIGTTYIVGTYRNFIEWCVDHEVNPKDPGIRFIRDEKHAHGHRPNASDRIIHVGGAWNAYRYLQRAQELT